MASIRKRKRSSVIQALVFAVVLTLVQVCFSSGGSSAQIGQVEPSMIPVGDEIAPSNLGDGEIWLGLPIPRFMSFAGDTVTVPIKLAAGANTREDIEIDINLLPKTGQNDEFKGAVKHHWINGYTANRTTDQTINPGRPDFSTVTRVNTGLPVTKYFRLNVPEKMDNGTYAFQVTTKNLTSEESQIGYFHITVHPSLSFGPATIEVVKGSGVLKADIRDRGGNIVDLDLVTAQPLGSSDLSIELIKQPDGSYYSKGAVPKEWSDKVETWRLKGFGKDMPALDVELSAE